MNLIIRTPALAAVFLLLVVSCEPGVDDDTLLLQRVSAAIAEASDLPHEGISVSVTEGVVRVSGNLDCAECGGLRTPGGAGTVQQSLGAVIRAVPGVEAVSFELTGVR